MYLFIYLFIFFAFQINSVLNITIEYNQKLLLSEIIYTSISSKTYFIRNGTSPLWGPDYVLSVHLVVCAKCFFREKK